MASGLAVRFAAACFSFSIIYFMFCIVPSANCRLPLPTAAAPATAASSVLCCQFKIQKFLPTADFRLPTSAYSKFSLFLLSFKNRL
jgi:hypothetical protein